MVQQYKATFKEVALKDIERDPVQPRRDFGADGDKNRLLLSIQEYGVEDPLKVTEVEANRYIIIDGHRRYICAKTLGLKTIPCRIYPKLSKGEFESRRYEMQNNRRPWRPLERAESLKRIRDHMKFRTNKELAEHLHMSTSVVANSLQLKKEKDTYLEMMARHEMSESYQIEFVRLRPKLRKIKDFEVDDIAKIIFEKVQHKIIRSSKEFRKLGRIFLRATANETEIHRFLKNPDMTVSELEQRTIQSGFSLLIEQLIQKVTQKRRDGVAFSSQEKEFLKQLFTLLKKVF